MNFIFIKRLLHKTAGVELLNDSGVGELCANCWLTFIALLFGVSSLTTYCLVFSFWVDVV